MSGLSKFGLPKRKIGRPRKPLIPTLLPEGVERKIKKRRRRIILPVMSMGEVEGTTSAGRPMRRCMMEKAVQQQKQEDEAEQQGRAFQTLPRSTDSSGAERWMASEKELLLEALYRHSPLAVEAIAKVIKTKTPDQVKDFLDKMAKNSYFDYEKRLVSTSAAPLELWQALLEEMTTTESEIDISKNYAKVMDTIVRNEFDDDDESGVPNLNWKNLNQFLCDLLADKAVIQPLSKVESTIILDMMHNIGETLHFSDTSKQRQLLDLKYQLLKYQTLQGDVKDYTSTFCSLFNDYSKVEFTTTDKSTNAEGGNNSNNNAASGSGSCSGFDVDAEASNTAMANKAINSATKPLTRNSKRKRLEDKQQNKNEDIFAVFQNLASSSASSFQGFSRNKKNNKNINNKNTDSNSSNKMIPPLPLPSQLLQLQQLQQQLQPQQQAPNTASNALPQASLSSSFYSSSSTLTSLLFASSSSSSLPLLDKDNSADSTNTNTAADPTNNSPSANNITSKNNDNNSINSNTNNTSNTTSSSNGINSTTLTTTTTTSADTTANASENTTANTPTASTTTSTNPPQASYSVKVAYNPANNTTTNTTSTDNTNDYTKNTESSNDNIIGPTSPITSNSSGNKTNTSTTANTCTTTTTNTKSNDDNIIEPTASSFTITAGSGTDTQQQAPGLGVNINTNINNNAELAAPSPLCESDSQNVSTNNTVSTTTTNMIQNVENDSEVDTTASSTLTTTSSTITDTTSSQDTITTTSNNSNNQNQMLFWREHVPPLFTLNPLTIPPHLFTFKPKSN